MTARVLVKRSLAVLLSFVMVVALMPMAEIGGKAQAAVAADNAVAGPIVEDRQAPVVKEPLSGGNRGNSIGSKPALRTVDGDVDINTAFPDEAFRTYVLNNIDTDQDGMLSTSEIEEVTYIDVSNLGISSLAGIEVFYNLQYLYCYYNTISELDVSENTALTDFLCYGNGMTSLVLGENSVLSCIHCNNNNLTELNVQGLPALSDLYCDGNQLTSLDVSKNSALEYLNCSSNQLTELTLGENSTLAYVNAQANKLSSLDISKATFLNNAVLDENAEIVQYYYYGADRFYDIWSYENNCILTVDSVTEVIATQPLGYCTVTFDSDGGSEVPSVSVLSGGRIVRPADPEKENYVFAGWYQDTAFATPFEFGEWGTLIESDTTLHARWYQPVSIADTFPDEVFCQFVSQYDSDEDGVLSYSEIQNVTHIDVSNSGITSLEGINVFFNLTHLYCSFNTISSLDVSANKALTNLECNYCGLESLAFGENSVLSSIDCYGNNLTTLNVQGLLSLSVFYCNKNQLTVLDISANTQLYSLNCSDNQLTTLDVSDNTALQYLYCSCNELTELILGENTVLEYVGADINKLQSLDISQVPILNNAALNAVTESNFYYSTNNYYDIWYCNGINFLTLDSETEVIATQPLGYCTVTFETNGGSVVSAVSVLPGRRITKPADPEKAGWAFAGWYQDTAFETPFEFGEYGTQVTGNITLYACWYQPVSIADTFPDEVFCEFVRQYDTDEDGKLSYSEIQYVTYMDVSNMGITSLEGIDVFFNLQYLYCYDNSISELDVSGNTALMNLSCYGNGMTSLVLGENSVLSCIHCENNNLTELNVQGLPALSDLYCDGNQLTSLDVSKNSALEYLNCSSNQLTELTLGENSTLAYVGATYNNLSSLDISEVSILNNVILDENAELQQYYYSDTNRFCDYWSYEYNTFLTVDSFTEVIATQPLDYCTVTFDSDGGSEVPSVSVLSGGRIVRPADPEKADWVFAGWYRNTSSVNPFEFGEYGEPIDSDTTLHARWHQPVNIADAFPDEVFCEYVRQYDIDEDGKLSYSELQYVTYMDVSNMGISSLEGIEAFCNLYELHCSYNSISSLDLSSNKALTNLFCNYCGLESLTFGENSVLYCIYCNGNSLTSLDVQGLPALYQLDCDDNQLTELIVSENPSLYSLNCAANQITSLDVSANGALSYLNCSQNQLTELTLGENDVLDCVYANVNKLSSLDVSGVSLIDEAVLNGEVEQIYWDPNDYFESWGYDGYSRLQVDSVTEIIASQTYDRFTVTFDTDGGTDIPSVSVLPGRRIPRPADPEKEDWAFAGWYQDTAFETPFKFGEYGTLIENDTTIHACWYKPVNVADTFPDEVFYTYIMNNIDSDQDGILSYSEIQNVTYLYLDEMGIQSLQGIDVFVNLTDLYCSNNSLSVLDVSKNKALVNLSCYSNGMTSLVLGENSVLSCIHCENNNLTELNVQGLPALSVLDCEWNQLTSLDVSKNSALEYLYCSSNQLTELNLGENNTLAHVGATYNNLSSLDISEVSILNDAILNENAELQQYYYSDTNRFGDYWSYEGNTFLTVDSFTEVIATQPLDYCTVTFDSKGGSEVSSVSVLSGGRIASPEDPVRESWVFAGWYQDTAFATPFEFGECGTLVEDDIVLYACWYQPVSIADTFPDEVFCEYVRQYDIDEDGKLSYSELQNVTFINVVNSGITSLEGINVFFNLTHLYCSFNTISSLDVSANKALTNLECNYCGLESLTFGENSVLSVICCSGNNLTALDVQGLPALYQIDCDNNQLTELIVSENPSLYSLNCAANQITSLDVSENGALWYLNCSNNKLTELTLGENDVLEYVYASVNNLSSLDVSKIPLVNEVFLNGESWQMHETPDVFFETWGYDSYNYLQVDSVTEVIATSPYTRYTVTFETDGGSEVASISVLPGRRISKPEDPEKAGWEFAGWYTDAVFATTFVFGENGTLIEDNIKLYARWYKPVSIADAFPDDVFCDYVSQYDTDEDGMLSYSEIQDVMFMNVSEKGITSLEGIETFINLQDLYCYENSISELDVSGNKSLMNLSCHDNEMTNLILGENSVLNCIHCENNSLTELNVQDLPALSVLNCEANQLTSLDFSKNSELQYLDCSWNRLTELTLGENSTLMFVAAQSNKLSSLDVSQVSFLNNALLDGNVEMWQSYSGAGFCDTWYYVNDTILVIDSNAQVIATQRLDYHSVMFDSKGGSEVPNVSVFVGGRIVRPADPEKEKQVFIGWYLDEEYQNPFYFGEDGTIVTEDMTLYALWANEVAIISEQPPISVIVMAGVETEVQIAAYGKEPITYQWQMYDADEDTWVNLSGEDATTDTLTFTAPAEKDIIRLRCVVTNGYGFPVASDEATVYINHLVFLTTPVDTVVQIGETVSFFVETNSENEPAYQWQYYDIDTEEWVDFPDESATTDTLSFVAGIEYDSLAFRCVVADEYNNVVESVGAVLHVTPIITSQTETAQALVGDKAEFNVSAEGVGPLTYQWQYRKNATDTWKTSGQSGNKTATLKVNTTAGMHGYQFRCIVTDGNNEEVISEAATLMLAPKITAQPEDAGAAEGTKAKFTVAATGKAAITYQWQYRTSATGTWKKSGQSGNKTATLTVTVKEGYDGYQFRCIVTDGNSQQTISETATLTISPKITAQPTDASVTVGTRATFTVEAVGEGTLTYQWQYRKDNTREWANSGQNGNKTATLSVATTAGLHGYQFRCIVTDGNSQQLASEAATLSLAPSITKQPADAFAGAGDKVKFTVTATGKSTLTYQWQYRTSATGTWKKSGQSGNKTATLTVTVKEGYDGYQFRCIVTDGNSQQTISEPATLTISPKITAQPTDASVTVGTRAMFTVEATGEGTLTYQWQYRKDNTREWANSGQNGNKTATLSVATTAGLHGYQFRCIVTDGSGRQLISNVATLALAPGITAQPEDTTAEAGSKATFTVTATGKATLTYQWQYRKDDTREWTNSGQSGNKTATLKVSTTKGLNGYQFRCVVTDGNEQITYTEVATLTVQ